MRSNSRKLLFTFLLLTLAIFSINTYGQLGVAMQVNHKTYLRFEHVFAKVFIRNYAGHTIAFGEAPELKGKLTFIIEEPGGSIVTLKGERSPLITGTVLTAGTIKGIVLPITKYYNMYKVGRYRVRAVIQHPKISGLYESKSVTFSISSGTKVWEKMIGVPDVLNKNLGKIEPRSYKIISLFDGMNSVFYLQVDSKSKIFAVIRLGFEINNSIKPACEIDSLSNIHILIQSSAKIFTYFVHDYNGKKIRKDVYSKHLKIQPVLVRDPISGKVIVSGGRKAIENLEYIEEDANSHFKIR